MDNKSRKLTAEERKKLAQELLKLEASDLDSLLGPAKKPQKSLKTPIEKLRRYKCIVEASVFWASRQAYLEIVQSFLSKKINGETFTVKFFQLRTKDLTRKEELCEIIEDRILPIPDLYYTSKANDFIDAIGDLYCKIDQYDPSIDDWDWNDIVYSESKLRSIIQEQFVPRLQHSCNLNDSFFRPQVD